MSNPIRGLCLGAHDINELKVDKEGHLVKIGRWDIFGKIDRRVIHKKEQDQKVKLLLSAKENSSPARENRAFTVTKSPLDEKIAELKKHKTVTPEQFPLIFELAAELEEALEAGELPDQQKYQKIYQKHVQPKLLQAKDMLEKRPMHYAIKAAASKGKAYVAAKTAVEALGKEFEQLTPNVRSSQEVVLLPQHGAVLKRMQEKNQEETEIVDSLFTMLSKDAVVGTFALTSHDYEAKPFVAMTLLHDLRAHPVAMAKILDSLPPEEEYKAILTGELQLLDLHAKNLGVAPSLSDELGRYTDFQIGTRKLLSLQEMLIGYLNGDIDDDTPVVFKEDGIKKVATIGTMPGELKDALKTTWKLVIFDTDLCLAEDNRLQVQTRKGKREHLVPLRSCFLESDWRDKPLSNATINTLLTRDDRLDEASKWAVKADAPILKQLSSTTKTALQEWLKPQIADFCLSKAREQESDTTIKMLRDAFSASAAKKASPLWNKVGQELGKKTPLSYKAKVKIAQQLFPRLTVRQLTALQERQKSIKEYLTNYNALVHYSGPDLRGALEKYLTSSPLPLSTPDKEALLSVLDDVQLESQLQEFKKIALEGVQPTFFTLMKACYPLLADVHALAAHVYGEELAGELIGHYSYPIEEICKKVRDESGDPIYLELATSIEQQVAAIADPSYFGNWR